MEDKLFVDLLSVEKQNQIKYFIKLCIGAELNQIYIENEEQREFVLTATKEQFPNIDITVLSNLVNLFYITPEYLELLKTKKAIVFYADGTKKTVKPKDGRFFNINELLDYVEGYIDIIPVYDKEQNLVKQIIINENGVNTKPINKNATDFLKFYVGGANLYGNVIFTDVELIN